MPTLASAVAIVGLRRREAPRRTIVSLRQHVDCSHVRLLCQETKKRGDANPNGHNSLGGTYGTRMAGRFSRVHVLDVLRR